MTRPLNRQQLVLRTSSSRAPGGSAHNHRPSRSLSLCVALVFALTWMACDNGSVKEGDVEDAPGSAGLAPGSAPIAPGSAGLTSGSAGLAPGSAGLAPGSASSTTTNEPAAQARETRDVPGADSSWLGGIQQRIRQGEYAIRPQGEGFAASNRAHHLEARFTPAGVEVEAAPGTPYVTGWQLHLALAGLGREGSVWPVEAARPAMGECLEPRQEDERGQCLRRVEYVRAEVTEWWENRTDGLEQGFTVEAAPAGRGPLARELEGLAAMVEEGHSRLSELTPVRAHPSSRRRTSSTPSGPFAQEPCTWRKPHFSRTRIEAMLCVAT